MTCETTQSQGHSRHESEPARAAKDTSSRPLLIACLLLLATVPTGCDQDAVPLFDKDGDAVPVGMDCDDNDPGIQSRYPDNDGDGFGAGNPLGACTATTGFATSGEDCDDDNPDIHPGATETCNGLDDDCDGQTDEDVSNTFYLDDDSDGFGLDTGIITGCVAPAGYTETGGDCDDDDPDIYPGATETCNNLDDDCDNQIDDGVALMLYRDQDGDGFGVDTETTKSCDTSSGWTDRSGDCDDTDPATYPGAEEACDGNDNDCDEDIDEGAFTSFFFDGDGDGFGVDGTPIESCTSPGNGFVTDGAECDDDDPTTYPGADETCDGRDNDCDEDIDEGAGRIYYLDRDEDGFGDAATAAVFCETPADAGYVLTTGDCDDNDPDIHPGVTETCNGLDDDCDDLIDEGLQSHWVFPDNDQDGYGDTSGARLTCEDGTYTLANYVPYRGDCNDADASVYPGANDPALGEDKDCGGTDGGDPFVTPAGEEQDARAHTSPGSQRTAPAGAAPTAGKVYDNIQSAIENASDGTIIWVAPGTYYEFGIDFQGKAIQVMSIAMAGDTVINGENDGGGDAPVVTFETEETNDAVLDGFTITNGSSSLGGGISIFNASPTIRYCTISSNSAIRGGGIRVLGAAPDNTQAVLSNILVSNNVAQTDGGGIYVKNASPILSNCVVWNNTAADGGGLYLEAAGGTLENTIVAYNQADNGGGIVITESLSGQTIQMRYTAVTGNTATKGAGGGLVFASGALATLENSVITNNVSSVSGGGAHMESVTVDIGNCVFGNNDAVSGNDIFFGEDCSAKIINTIFVSNADQFAISDTGAPFATISYSDVFPLALDGLPEAIVLGDGMRSEDPDFITQGIEATIVIPHLALSSTLVDAGTPDAHDPDGSPNDMGCFGGPLGDGWDLDGDGCPAWFWPGEASDAPPGLDPHSYDTDDLDPLANPCEQ